MSHRNQFATIEEIDLADPGSALVYEHGWQSWSPVGLYRADRAASPRPRRAIWQTMAFRPDAPAPPDGFQGEGLLAVLPDGLSGPVRTWLAPAPERAVASIRARLDARRLVLSANGAVMELPPAPSLNAALTAAAERFAEVLAVPPPSPLGPGWCSWYGYGSEVSDAVLSANMAVMDQAGLDVRLIQIDDGYQASIGDWLEPSGRIADLAATAATIRDSGREAGIWTAPFMAGESSRLALEHPDWLVGDAVAAEHHWGQRIRVLDVTHPEAAEHLAGVFRTLRAWGFTYHKLDFLYAGAMAGRRHGEASPIEAYREGLRIIRRAVGDDATILGCGAPLLASIGLVDAMRISPDTDPLIEPADGDISQPSIRGALSSGRARAWMHGRLWVNDPDCIIASPRSQDRPTWAAHLGEYRGLAMSGDALPDLDARGLELTRQLLQPSAADAPLWLPDAGPDGGRLERPGETAPRTAR